MAYRHQGISFENHPSEAWLLPSEVPRRTRRPESVSVSRSRSRSKSTCVGKTGHGCRDARRKSSPGTCIAAPHAARSHAARLQVSPNTIPGPCLTRPGRGFDHDDSACESRDQTIAAWKRAGVRPLARWMLGHETALREHPVIQRAIRRRIDNPESIAEDTDRATTGVERRRVRDRIDAPRHAADDDRTLSHRSREDPRGFGTIRRVIAAADEGHARPREQGRIAPDVEDGGGIADLFELRRKIGRTGQ